MNRDDKQIAKMLAYEYFIRRAAKLGMPFMLKGSYVTRQYFVDPVQRTPADLDWLYLERLNDPETSRSIFNKWVTMITELKTNDGVEFMSFSENGAWRLIDYAMHDDFPTTYTELACRVDQHEIHSLEIDISFNLPVEFPPVPLLYKPLRGEPFTIPYTTPLCLQVSWKIHQTLIRPRFKDLFDLTYLLQHPSFSQETQSQSIQALVYESNKDRIDLIRFYHFLSGHIDVLFGTDSHSVFESDIESEWEIWRNKRSSAITEQQIYIDHAEQLTDINKLPYKLSDFINNFYDILKSAGFRPSLINASFKADWKEKAKYDLHHHENSDSQRKEEKSNDAVLQQETDKINVLDKQRGNTLLARLRKLFRRDW